MNIEKQLTDDDFLERYNCIKNHLDPDAGFDGYEFGTNGLELEFVRDHDDNYVFTIIDNNDGWYGIVAGYHWINRMGYLISSNPWTDENEEYTIYDTTELREQWESLPLEVCAEISGFTTEEGFVFNEDDRDESFWAWEELDEETRQNTLNKWKSI